MKTEEIIKNATVIQLPNGDRIYETFENRIYIFPSKENDKYYDWVNKPWNANTHHYTTKYHREVFLPTLLPLLKIDNSILERDYHLEERLDRSGKYDLSILHPNNKEKHRFTIILPTDGNQRVDNLSFDDLVTKDSKISDFHSLWYAPHKVSYIINETLSSGKKLFISGDSQMIPSMAILATLFKEIVYLDNRTKTSTKPLYEGINYTDILFELNFNDITKYTVENMK